MIREIVNTAGPTFTLHFPNDLIGKRVEIIAFEVEDEKKKSQDVSFNSDKIKEIQAITRNSLVDLSSYKFSRGEANNYDEL